MVPLANCVYHVSVVLEESWFFVQSRKEFCKISYSREAETCKISYSTLDHDYDEIDQEGLGGNPVYL